jgi:dienelactone hydrolase
MNRSYLITIAFAMLMIGCTPMNSEKPIEKQSAAIGMEEPRITPDIVYGHKFGLALTFDMFQPYKQNGAGIIFINSGRWRAIFPNFYKETLEGIRLATEQERAKMNPENQGKPSIKPLLDKGFTVFVVRHGDCDKFKMSEIVANLRCAVRFIRFHAAKYGINEERLGVWGGSAGGHLALLIGTTADVGNKDATEEFAKSTDRVAAVVAYMPLATLERPNDPAVIKQMPALDMRKEEYREFSPLYFVSPDDAPTLIVHGDKDQLVPILQGKSMYQALLKAGVKSKFVTIPGAGHAFFGKDDDRAMQETISWFEEQLIAK